MPPDAAHADAVLWPASAGNMSVDSLYDRGQRALDNHEFDQALDAFTEVATRGGARADAALYWKAYTLNKLGRRDEAMAASTNCARRMPAAAGWTMPRRWNWKSSSRRGRRCRRRAESDDELKLLALNGLVQCDPDRALPHAGEAAERRRRLRKSRSKPSMCWPQQLAQGAADAGTDCPRQRQSRPAIAGHSVHRPHRQADPTPVSF